MSDILKTENEMFALLRGCIIEGLSYFGVENFDVRKFAQANFNHGDWLVLLNLTDTSRIGWQSHTYKDVNGNYVREDQWCEEQSYQISTMKRMRSDDTEDTITAEDVSSYLISWFNGPAIMKLREQGVAPLYIDPNSIIVYNDDSDLYQRRPVFTVKIHVPKKFQASATAISALEVETHPV